MDNGSKRTREMMENSTEGDDSGMKVRVDGELSWRAEFREAAEPKD